MALTNGRLPTTALTTVEAGVQLSIPTARAWTRLAAAAKTKLGRAIRVAAPYGGYRSWAVQDGMHQAGSKTGTRAQRLKYGLNPNSSVSIAEAGSSSHGLGTRVDVVGTPIDGAFLDLAKQYGFTREFGAADPNHFAHDGKTACAPDPAPAAKTVVVQADDTLSKIAAAHGTTWQKLATLNKLSAPYVIHPGQKLALS